MSRWFFLRLIFLVPLVVGCQEPPPQPETNTVRKTVSKLTVLVVDDLPLAAGLRLLQGEWDERTGGQLEIQDWTTEQLLAATEIEADLIVFSSRYLGTLVDRDWLRPIRQSILDSEEIAAGDIISLVRNTVLPYGNQVYALTLGEPPLMLSAAAAVTQDGEQTLRKPWKLGFDSKKSTCEYPLATELLVRAVAHTPPRSRSANWFDVASMEPQVTSQPFVRALEQMIANATQESRAGGSKLAISWPVNVATKNTEFSVFFPIPTAQQIYNPVREQWEDNDAEEPIAFLGFAGRSVGVTRATRNSASAFKLLKWLVSQSVATQLSPRSRATVWFRKSQLSQAKKWVAGAEHDQQAVDAVNKLLSSSNHYLLPRIPEIDEYLQTMEGGVEQAFSADRSAEAVLRGISDAWNQLTDRLGRDRQRVAYRKHLGFDGSSK